MRRAPRPRVLPSKLRPLNPTLDHLEARALLSTLPGSATAHPTYLVSTMASSSPPASAMTPAQVQHAYGFDKVSFGTVHGDGSGETIAVVDASDDPNIQADLNTFSTQFGLPAATVTRVGQDGGSVPATDPTGGWETEEALDVEWAHAIAPGASILLVEANSASFSDLMTAVDYASAHASVVSMSWGGGEFAGENQAANDGHFSHPGVVYVASSGDSGAPASWPAVSPDVLSVGGTRLTLDSSGAWAGETGWSGSGGGPSVYESQPVYQESVVTQTTTQRGNPDVAYDASPSTGFAIYDSFAGSNSTPGWLQVGGTSAGAPQWAALVAIADQGRALNGLAPLNSTSPQEVMTTLYQGAGTAEFHDVTSGGSAGSPGYSAGPGYDYVTGIGSPVANLVVPSLVGVPTAPPASSDHLVIAAPAAGTAGSAQTVTVTADDASGAADPGYRDTVHFSSSDVQAGLPANYTFTAGDAGSHTFTLTLKTAGSQSVTAADASAPAVASASATIAVSPAAASQIILAGLPASATAGSPLTLTATLKDPYGNVATGYRGTVHFSSTDALATLPADTAFTASDAGRKSFLVTFATPGTQTVTASDTATGFSATTAGTAVAPAATSGSTSLWSNAFAPTVDSYSWGSYEVGVKFRTDVPGTITALRFYKESWMGGATHVGHLWTSTGTLLATAKFTGETASGWQQVTLSQPVPVSAGSVYIASFSTGGGDFGISTGYFNGQGVDSGSLHALANGVSGGDGVYHWGNGSFPSTSANGMNFWADVVFNPTASTSVSTATFTSTSKYRTSTIWTSTGMATPTAAAQPTAAVPTRRTPAATLNLNGSWSYRRTVPQPRAFTLPRTRGSVFSGLAGA